MTAITSAAGASTTIDEDVCSAMPEGYRNTRPSSRLGDVMPASGGGSLRDVVVSGDSPCVPHPGHAPGGVSVARKTTRYAVAPPPCHARTRSTDHPRRAPGDNH
ncbi:hypothetical protein GCM10009788_29610 [Nocardioides humi]|uniref:Uncharacterized protein n=1 Tax=Nocardioides humi TaxID=449461 RepID=A0ABN2APM9_9ACTN